jgi:hypothetical protein
MNTIQTLDVVATIAVYFETTPHLYSNEDASIVTSVVWNSQVDADNNTLAGVVLDPVNDILIIKETEDHNYPLNTKYMLAGICSLNDLSFDVIISDKSVTCGIGEDVVNGTDNETASSKVEAKPIVH